MHNCAWLSLVLRSGGLFKTLTASRARTFPCLWPAVPFHPAPLSLLPWHPAIAPCRGTLLWRRYGQLTGRHVALVDLSVSETMHNLVALAAAHPTEKANLLGEALKVSRQFKVPDKRFWHVKVRALAASHQWDDLRKFANEKKSPIGYKPFAERCIEQRQPPDSVAW